MAMLLVLLISISFLIYSFWQLKAVNRFSVFALDRNAFGSFAIYCTLLASGIGAGHLMGAAEKSYATGWFYTIACLGFSFQLLMQGWLSPRIFSWRHCLSSGEILGEVYGGWDVRFIAGVLWLLFCTGIVSAQVVAMHRVTGMLIPEFQFEAALLLSITVILYSCLGGIRSVVSTDVLQAVLLLLALLAVVIWGVQETGGAWSFYHYNADSLQTLIKEDVSFVTIAIFFFVFFLGDALIPVSIQRITMARNARQASVAMYAAALVVALVVLLSGALGTIAFMLDGSQLPKGTFPILMNHMPGWLDILLLAGLLAAVMSSCDSYLNSAAVAFSNDVLAPLAKTAGDDWLLMWGRIATLAIGAGAILIAYQMDDILDILVNSFELWTPTLLPAMLFTLYYRNTDRWFFYLPFFSGIAGLLLWKLVVHDEVLSAGASLAGMVAGLACILILLRFRKTPCSRG